MKKGITPIIAIVLLLMMTVGAFGITTLWVTNTQEQMQNETTQQFLDTAKKISSCMKIVSSNFNKVYLKNCGRNGVISNKTLNIYVNGVPANYTLSGDIEKNKVGAIEIEFPSVKDENTILFDSDITTISEVLTKSEIKNGINTDTSLVGYWSFDEGSGMVAKDSSGKGNDGTLNGGLDTTGWIDGKANKALQFDGVNDYVGVASSSIGTTNQMSIVVWVNPGLQSLGSYTYSKDIIRSQCNGGGGVWGIVTDNQFNTNSRIALQLGWITGVDTWWNRVSENTVDINEWNHLVLNLNRDTGKVSFYHNGAFVSDRTYIVGTKLQTSGLRIASDCAGAFNGTIDEVRIWNRALSPKEIKTLYEMDA